MAKTQTIEIPAGLEDLFDASIERRDRFILGVAQAHKFLPSRSTKARLLGQSLFRFMATIWATLTTEEKAEWKAAGVFSNLTNWQLFISDNAARLRYDLPLNQGVSDKWQVRTGFVDLSGFATEIKIYQEHPLDYWVTQKMAGKPWKQELVKIHEKLGLPLEIGLSYKADLEVAGENPLAKFYARVQSSYQGQDIFTDLEIDLTPETDWVVASDTLSSVLGYLVGYRVIFHIEDYQGVVFFDNLIVSHTGQNWGRDPRFDNMTKEFKKAFALVRPFWVPEVLPAGATYQSVYPPAEI